MWKYFILVIFLIICTKKFNDNLLEDGNIYRERKNSTIVKLKGEDYRHYCKGDKAFVVNMWKFNNFNKEDMDLFKRKILKNIRIYKKYKYDNYIKIMHKNKKAYKCFLKEPVSSCKEMLKIAQKSDIQVLFSLNYEKGEFIISYNHGIFDGLSMTKMFQKIIKREPYEIKYLTTIKNILYSFTKIHSIPDTVPILKDLDNPIRIEIKIESERIKKLQKKYNFSFNAAYSYLILKMINLNNIGVGTLTTGIQKKKAFNSYGIIPFVYSKKDKPDIIQEKINNNSGTSLLSNVFISYSSSYLKKMYANKNIL